jgi:hypothetical protein
MIDTTLNAVEDEFSHIPYDPEVWRTDGRMYPAQDDSIVELPNHLNITCFRHRSHRTYIGVNGSFEIRDRHGVVQVSKAGTDGYNQCTDVP